MCIIQNGVWEVYASPWVHTSGQCLLFSVWFTCWSKRIKATFVTLAFHMSEKCAFLLPSPSLSPIKITGNGGVLCYVYLFHHARWLCKLNVPLRALHVMVLSSQNIFLPAVPVSHDVLYTHPLEKGCRSLYCYFTSSSRTTVPVLLFTLILFQPGLSAEKWQRDAFLVVRGWANLQ